MIELTDEATLLSSVKRTVPRDVKVARRAGVTCTLATADTDAMDRFVDSYWEGTERQGAAAFYRFPRTFFQTLV